MGIKKMKIKEFAEVVSGSTPKTKVDEYWNGEYFWITPAEIKEGDKYINYTSRTITKEGVDSCSLRELRPNTVLLSSRAPIGKVALLGNSMYCNQGFKNLICNEEIVNPEYIYYWLSSKKEYLNSLGRGATFKEISKKIVEDIEVPVQTLEEQKKIVNVLNKAQELIEKRKEQIELLDELVKSRFIEMFGDPVTNPKGWEKGRIADIVVKTQYGTSAKADEQNGEFKVLRMNNITYGGHWDFSSMKYVDLNEKDKEKYLVYKGEVLFNRTNSKELVGKTAVYKEDKPMAYAGYLVRAIPNERATGEFIAAYMNTKYIKAKLINMAKSIVGMANINAEEFKKIDIYIPPIELQNKYIQFVEQADKLKFEMEKSLKELENNFNSLMQKSFNGEL